jgi:hypothetical protein
MSSMLTYNERVALTSILTEGRVNLSKLARMLGGLGRWCLTGLGGCLRWGF